MLLGRWMCESDTKGPISEFRPYRPSQGILPALQEIMKQKGILFDEQVVNTCLKLFLEKNYVIK